MGKGQFNIKIPKIDLGLGPKKKRTLSLRDRQILYARAKGRCEACGRKISFEEMQVGHKKAYSKGGATTLANAVCLCYRCNKLQGTDDFKTFKKKLTGTYGKKSEEKSTKKKRRKTRSPFSIEVPKVKIPKIKIPV
jgi:5-methylcytosine-specific restriction endonuclease McrA